MGDTLRVVVAVALVLCLGACGFAPGSSPRAKRTPVPDEELYAQIAAMPHVVSVDLQHDEDRFGYSAAYWGTVTVDAVAVPACVLDEVFATLRSGPSGLLSGVRVSQGGKYFDATMLGLGPSASARAWVDRYGDLDPASVPTPRPPLPSGVACE